MNAAHRIEPLDPVELAAELIRRPSITPRDEGAIPYLAGVLEPLGFTCQIEEFAEPGTEKVLNLYARLGRSGRNFCFAGHTDVVPPGEIEAWTLPPFGGTIRDEMLHGRGAADMKGAIACFVAAAAGFVVERRNLRGSISLLITGDEEGARINGTRKMLAAITARGEKLDACIVGEPTSSKRLGDMVKIGRRGSLYVYLTAHGTQGHVAYPGLADNAAHRIVAMLQALTATPLDTGTAHFEASTLQIATIDIGNKTDNVIPGVARATLSVRYNDRWTSAALKEWLKAKLDAVGGRYELRYRESSESFLVRPGEVSNLVATAIERVAGVKPELSTTGGTSDACFIHRYCPLAEFGLVGQTTHKIDERVALADLAELTEIYRTVLDLYFPAA